MFSSRISRRYVPITLLWFLATLGSLPAAAKDFVIRLEGCKPLQGEFPLCLKWDLQGNTKDGVP